MHGTGERFYRGTKALPSQMQTVLRNVALGTLSHERDACQYTVCFGENIVDSAQQRRVGAHSLRRTGRWLRRKPWWVASGGGILIDVDMCGHAQIINASQKPCNWTYEHAFQSFKLRPPRTLFICRLAPNPHSSSVAVPNSNSCGPRLLVASDLAALLCDHPSTHNGKPLGLCGSLAHDAGQHGPPNAVRLRQLNRWRRSAVHVRTMLVVRHPVRSCISVACLQCALGEAPP